jgi:hypothetical protein
MILMDANLGCMLTLGTATALQAMNSTLTPQEISERTTTAQTKVQKVPSQHL